MTRFQDDGRICMTNNAAECALSRLAGRIGHLPAAIQEDRRAAVNYTLIETCKLNDVDTHARLADTLARIADHPTKRIAEPLPWNGKATRLQAQASAA